MAWLVSRSSWTIWSNCSVHLSNVAAWISARWRGRSVGAVTDVWVRDLERQADEAGLKLYMKTNLFGFDGFFKLLVG